MSAGETLLLFAAAAAAVYALLVAALLAFGRRSAARALAGFIPDCVILVRRLLRDPRVPRRRKLVLGALVGYLVLPVDLVPDFIPVAGQLDDLVVAALALRYALRSGGRGLVEEHWPGPPGSLGVVLAAAFGGVSPARARARP